MLNFNLGEPLRLAALASRRAIRSITFALMLRISRFGGSASMRFAEGRAFPLAKMHKTQSIYFQYIITILLLSFSPKSCAIHAAINDQQFFSANRLSIGNPYK